MPTPFVIAKVSIRAFEEVQVLIPILAVGFVVLGLVTPIILNEIEAFEEISLDILIQTVWYVKLELITHD